jgi:protein-disulfide isomerase
VDFPAPSGSGVADFSVPLDVDMKPGKDGSKPVGTMRVASSCPDCAGKMAAPVASASERVVVDAGAAPSFGPATARVTVVEFTDFECPFCARAHETMEALRKEFGDQVRFVFKQRPLAFHKNAQVAAQAALAAHEQGRYLELREKLFTSDAKLSRESVEKHASEVGMDVTRLKSALDSNRHQAAVAQDIAQAEQLGIRATPSVLVNGRRIEGARPIEVYREVIKEELAQSR